MKKLSKHPESAPRTRHMLLEHSLRWPAFQRVVGYVQVFFSQRRGRTHAHIARHSVHGATDGHAEKFAETTEDDGILVRVGYLELVVEEKRTPARGSLDRVVREVDDKAHRDRICNWIECACCGLRSRRAVAGQRQRSRRLSRLHHSERAGYSDQYAAEFRNTAHRLIPARLIARPCRRRDPAAHRIWALA